MGKHIAVVPILTVLLLLASSVRLERLADGKYRVEAIFAVKDAPRRVIAALFTTHEEAKTAYWQYLLEKTQLGDPGPAAPR